MLGCFRGLLRFLPGNIYQLLRTLHQRATSFLARSRSKKERNAKANCKAEKESL
jgi:hypothetical protein